MVGTVLNDCGRAYSYKVLAECYYLPDDQLLKTLQECGNVAGEVLSEVIRNAPQAEDLEHHRVEYSRLFVGPFKLLAPPYGSIYLDPGFPR